jgi:hypothetical protein
LTTDRPEQKKPEQNDEQGKRGTHFTERLFCRSDHQKSKFKPKEAVLSGNVTELVGLTRLPVELITVACQEAQLLIDQRRLPETKA